MPHLFHKRPITIASLNVLTGNDKRGKRELFTCVLYECEREFITPAYYAGKRVMRERTNGILLYFGIIFDTTPNCAHVEQMSQVM